MDAHTAARAWLDAAVPPESRPASLTPKEVAELDEALVNAVGRQHPDAKLLQAAGGEAAVAEWYNRPGAQLGRMRSRAKTAAARANGAKGGRPRKS